MYAVLLLTLKWCFVIMIVSVRAPSNRTLMKIKPFMDLNIASVLEICSAVRHSIQIVNKRIKHATPVVEPGSALEQIE